MKKSFTLVVAVLLFASCGKSKEECQDAYNTIMSTYNNTMKSNNSLYMQGSISREEYENRYRQAVTTANTDGQSLVDDGCCCWLNIPMNI